MSKHLLSKLAPAAALLLWCGCASSERMSRLSGGIMGEYSAPASQRLRSKRSLAVTQATSSAAHGKTPGIAGKEETLVNIWPFFFRDRNYWSILWPMIDADPYGLAVRPFYNHEGDDYSILFPLCAWNTGDSSWWFANWVSTPEGCGLVPLTWRTRNQMEGIAYCFPFYHRSWNRQELTPDNWRRKQESGWSVLLLARYARYCSVDYGEWQWLRNSSFHEKSVPAYRYRLKGRYPVPANQQEYRKLQQEIFPALPRKTEVCRQILPLWKHESDNTGGASHYFFPLYSYCRKKNESSFSLLPPGLLFYSGRKEYHAHPGEFTASEQVTALPVLLSWVIRERHYQEDSNLRLFRELAKMKYNPAPAIRQEIQTKLRQLTPAAELPAEVVNQETWGLFLNETFAKYKFPEYEEVSGNVPVGLCYFSSSPREQVLSFPLLLTWKVNDADGKRFVSLPLCSWNIEKPGEKITAIIPPLGTFRKFTAKEPAEAAVYESGRKWADQAQTVIEDNCYALLGLYFRGKHYFQTVKPGGDAAAAEAVRTSAPVIAAKLKRLNNREKELELQLRRAEVMSSASKVEHYRRLLRIEELKEQLEEQKKERQKCLDMTEKLMASAAKAGDKFDPAALNSPEECRQEINRFLTAVTVLRGQKDAGSGIFFRREENCSGDFRWSVLGQLLAGGFKEGSREECQILHLLYRSRRDGEKEEKIFFPFFSRQREGNWRCTAFLWRFLSIESDASGITGGNIFFIPFGNVK